MNLQEKIKKEINRLDNERIIEFCNKLCEESEYIYLNTIDGIKNLCSKYKISKKTKIIIWLMSKCDEEYKYFKYDDKTDKISYINDSDLIDNVSLDTMGIDILMLAITDSELKDLESKLELEANNLLEKVTKKSGLNI